MKIVIGDATFYHGDCLEIIKHLPSQSINCCVTSPPYFGLRDYDHDDQIGLDPSPEEYIQKLVNVFREVKRVLRDDGTLWLNLGDSYSQSGNGGSDKYTQGYVGKVISSKNQNRLPPVGYKPKNLLGIPWRVAFALQTDGWYLRQDIIWHKPNPMPESVRDRCTKSHEYIFLLSKSLKYYYDYEAIKEQCVDSIEVSLKKKACFGGRKKHEGYGTRLHSGREYRGMPDNKRNKRSVWTIPTRPFKGAHFATFPPKLAETCILAGCPEEGVVLDPFGGSGTSSLVSYRNRRKSILCELNSSYFDMAVARYRRETAQLRIGEGRT